MPDGDRYFHVAHLASDGAIYHYGPKFIDAKGIGDRFLYQTGAELAANNKIEIILAIASKQEIFAFERAASEPTLDFLAVMNGRFPSGSKDLAIITIKRDVGR